MARARPLAVYLDSSDFSEMSNPKAQANVGSTRERLIDFAKSKEIRFVFSAAHISEMAPIEARDARWATERTDLLVALCKRNCVISLDRLINNEARNLIDRVGTVEAIMDDGTWFPDVGQIVTPATALDPVRALYDKASEHGLNRKQRRLVKSKSIKGDRFRSNAFEGIRDKTLDDILKMYPMRRKDADVLMRYIVGSATVQQAEEAFLESLRDPSWMMRWFYEHHDRLGPVGEWVRGPARTICQKMADAADTAARALQFEQVIGQNVVGAQLSASGWRRLQDELVVHVATHAAGVHGDDSGVGARGVNASDVDKLCPGISVCVRVMHSSLRNAIGKYARAPVSNDIVDAVHAMYAPYVDIFRGDSYMSPLIAKHAKKYGTAVVPRLDQLPLAIESALAYA